MSRMILKALLTAVLLAGPVARAAYLESDGGPTPTPAPAPRPDSAAVRLPPPAGDHALARLASRLTVGAPLSYRGLTVFSLYLRSPAPAQDILTLDDAAARGQVVVREKGSGEVPFLLVRNDAARPVLLLAGEMLLGGRQNRLVRDDVLLPPRSGTIDVDVYCGEQHRWAGDEGAVFKSAGSLAAPQLREQAARGDAQDRIWREIDGQLDRAAASSSTRSYQAVYEQAEVQRRLGEYAEALRSSARGGAVGCVIVSRGRIRGADLFTDPELFARLFDKICRSYASDLVLERDADRWGNGRRRMPDGDEADIRRFLGRVADARVSPRRTPGEGELLSVAGAVTGSALVWRGEVVHAGLFDGAWLLPPPVREPPHLGPWQPQPMRE